MTCAFSSAEPPVHEADAQLGKGLRALVGIERGLQLQPSILQSSGHTQ